MAVETRDTAVAYTYAWWLSGDDETAEQAVRTAVDRLVPERTTGRERLERLLSEVRTVAAPNPTMCPASELALLHDHQGIDLDIAARLAVVDLTDARTELAHGRFEALVERVTEPFAHPERLGGLAVGNPADIAHARQCDSCAHARQLLLQGRRELQDLPAVEVPDTLAELLPAPASVPSVTPAVVEKRPATVETPPAVEVEAPPAVEVEALPAVDAPPEADELVALPPVEAPPAPAVEAPTDVVEAPAEAAPPPTEAPSRLEEAVPVEVIRIPTPAPPVPEAEEERLQRRANRGWMAVAIVTGLTAMFFLLPITGFRLVGDGPTQTVPGGQPEPAQPDPAEPDPAPRDPLDEGVEPEAPDTDLDEDALDPADAPGLPGDEGPQGETSDFRVVAAGVLTGASTTPLSGVEVAPDEPLRIMVQYEGATEGVVILGRWTVDGEPFDTLRVVVSSRRGSHAFSAQVPDEGWPSGTHQVLVVVDGAIVAAVDFRVP